MNPERIEAAAKADHETGWCANWPIKWEDVSEQHRQEHRNTVPRVVSAWIGDTPVYEHDGEAHGPDGAGEALRNAMDWGMVEVKSDD